MYCKYIFDSQFVTVTIEGMYKKIKGTFIIKTDSIDSACGKIEYKTDLIHIFGFFFGSLFALCFVLYTTLL